MATRVSVSKVDGMVEEIVVFIFEMQRSMNGSSIDGGEAIAQERRKKQRGFMVADPGPAGFASHT
jgi:hypothetical protein